MSRNVRTLITLAFCIVFSFDSFSQSKKPNILVIWGDDIGITNVSAYSRGLMGYHTPNIDRIAKEGILFTDYYGEQSCTAGRAAFITGQSPVRTGLTKVGMPGADLGIQAGDPTIAELLKPLGYATAQFGKNHLGDKDEFLPTNHGFDQFFGNLYHLNSEEEPENPDYPDPKKYPDFRKNFGPRGVIKSSADGPIEDTGPLTKKRMETVDREFLEAAKAFIKEQVSSGKPFFVWFNSTRMHFYTHISDDIAGQSGQGFYNDAMMEHDGHVGELLDLLEELKVVDNTIVCYSTDNGPHYNEWPDGGISPFRGEKNTNWEGGYRVPSLVRWPGKFPAGMICNEIMSHTDWLPTLVAAAGNDNVKDELMSGFKAGSKSFKVHLDGYNFLPHLMGEVDKGPREEFFYFNDDGQLVNIRYNDWKLVFMEQLSHGMAVWRDPFVSLRAPKIFNLRRDPFERADTDSNNYNHWWVKHAFLLVPAQAYVGKFIETFKDYPPRQRPAKFNLDEVMESLYQTN
ncbi:arylsulfatase [Pontibacter sp. G13]|uniref:arylsulfatase n=1 Tax=Pontibacter sp. G13 TaxID=3074898 RepID=UPI00288996D0|nr:arylsulfatase [Pontibacter sp. G13]WNJ17358.1 arylsulfatase [Pontibacter sp. G13]